MWFVPEGRKYHVIDPRTGQVMRACAVEYTREAAVLKGDMGLPTPPTPSSGPVRPYLVWMMTGGGTSEEPAAAADASMSRPARAEAAGEEPELTHEQAQAQKAHARKELLALRDQMNIQKDTLDFLLLHEEELATKVEGKPSVYAQLEACRAAEVRAPRHPPLAGAGVVC